MTARVLVVDDLLPNVKLLEAKLTSEYFDVVTAGDHVIRADVIHAHLQHLARDIEAQDPGEAEADGPSLLSGADLPVDGVDGGGGHPEADVGGPLEDGVGHLLDDEVGRRAIGVESGSAHAGG